MSARKAAPETLVIIKKFIYIYVRMYNYNTGYFTTLQ